MQHRGDGDVAILDFGYRILDWRAAAYVRLPLLELWKIQNPQSKIQNLVTEHHGCIPHSQAA
jgi:hypothetical protein